MLSRSPLIKVLLLFMAGIVAPTVFLMYLGALSIRSENLLLKKDLQEREGKTAQTMRDQAQELIDNAMAPFVKAAASGALDDLRQARGAQITTLFLFDGARRSLYPVSETPASGTAALPPLQAEQKQAMAKAESLEFRDKNYESAAGAYHALAEAAESPRWKAIFLNNEAGCRLKERRFDAAESLYREILDGFNAERDQDGYPFGLVIGSQLAALQEQKGRPDLAFSGETDVLRQVLAHRWNLSWEESQFFIRRTDSRLKALESHASAAHRARWKAMMNQWNERLRSLDAAKSFLQARWPGVQKSLRAAGRADAPTLLFAESDFHSALLYAPVQDPQTGALTRFLIAEVRTDALLEQLTAALDQLAGASGNAYRLATSPTKSVLPANSSATAAHASIREDLKGTIPALHLWVAPQGNVPLERAADRRRRVYIGMIALAGLVIVIALYATWYAVSREMEVAQLKSQFVAGISHELKTPLSIIDFIGQKLQLGRFGSVQEAQDYYGMITEETARLKSMIDEVLDFSRLMENRKPYQKIKTDLEALVRDTADRFRRGIQSEGTVNLTVDTVPCEAPVDPEALSRVILNLLDNAVKYSPPDRARISLSLVREGSGAVIAVRDQGYGISADEQKLVFERFYRGKSASDHTKTNGAGLGLSIVQHIVEAHGGRIELQSVLGKGSIFSVRIPLGEPHA